MVTQNLKRGFIPRDFVIALLLFSGILTLLTLAVASLAEDYGNTEVIDPEFSNRFNKFDQELDRSADIFNSTTSTGGLSLVGTFDVLFSSTFTVISLVFGGVSAVGSQIAGFGDYFGIPKSVAYAFFGMIMAILAILIVFMVVSSVSRRDL